MTLSGVVNNPRSTWYDFFGLPEDIDEITLSDVRNVVTSYVMPSAAQTEKDTDGEDSYERSDAEDAQGESGDHEEDSSGQPDKAPRRAPGATAITPKYSPSPRPKVAGVQH